MTGGRKSAGSSPCRPLYWLGAGIMLLALGVLALAVLERKPPADPERILIWLYDSGDRTAPATLLVVEESRSRQAVRIVAAPAPAEARAAFGRAGAGQAQATVQAALGRRLHHRIFVPEQLLARLVDAVGGIQAGGTHMDGAEARAYMGTANQLRVSRTAEVIQATVEAAASQPVAIGAQEGLALLRQIETTVDLSGLPDRAARWKSYSPGPQIQIRADLAQVRSLLTEDPPTTR